MHFKIEKDLCPQWSTIQIIEDIGSKLQHLPVHKTTN